MPFLNPDELEDREAKKQSSKPYSSANAGGRLLKAMPVVLLRYMRLPDSLETKAEDTNYLFFVSMTRKIIRLHAQTIPK